MAKPISWYYHQQTKNLLKFLTNGESSYHYLAGKAFPKKRPGYIIFDNIVGDLGDIQQVFSSVNKRVIPTTRIIVTYYNHFWEPILKLASMLGWRKKVSEQNWLDDKDIINLLNLSGFEHVATYRQILLPIYIPVLTPAFNRILATMPLFNSFCLSVAVVARPKQTAKKEMSVTIVVPARNEEGNINRVFESLPKFGRRQELIFVEGHSKDQTWGAIKDLSKKKKRPGLTVKAYRQTGIGKADAVRLGFGKATGNLLMILDADLTVPASDLVKFYEAYRQGLGEFVNGCRLVYPLEEDAMRMLNKLGNKIFSFLFSWILRQRFKDTLCGTKVISRLDYQKIVKLRKQWGDFDPFGDYELIFGAVKLNLKVVDLPVRYQARTYGSTNISRWRHGVLLLQMTANAYRRFSWKD